MSPYRAGIFTVVELTSIGLLLKWDRTTRVYLKLDEQRWKGRVEGLCGNYNGDVADDFTSPSKGVETNALIFGHSWRLDDSCMSEDYSLFFVHYCSVEFVFFSVYFPQAPTEPVDSCKLIPQRQAWSQKKCSILKSSVFGPCHSAVPFESFYKRCIFDACSCDQGEGISAVF